MHRYSDHPATAVWETMYQGDPAQRCDGSSTRRDDKPLDTAEATRMLQQLASARVPHVVFVAGAPARRSDLVDLLAYGVSLDLVASLALGAAPVVTPGLVRRLARTGLSRLAVGIHGQGTVTHEAFVGVAGSFEAALRTLADARGVGIATQVDTTIHAGNVRQVRRIADIVELVGAARWNVSYLVPDGPRQTRLLPSPEAVTGSLGELLDVARTRPFKVRTSGAPNYPRHVARRDDNATTRTERELEREDERGFVFVDGGGGIYPHRLLPVRCGDLRADNLLDVYRRHLVFRLLRTPDMLGGKCRGCSYRHVCAGSRARAYALTRSLTAEDPLCAHIPSSYESAEERRSPL